mmetsp:Transcript_138290/g.350520  ORF Transcript_138290/g.350520 Transcript_138290/m.350520 type:complete len:200 (-) Transcript_138290:4914-5513(-)
MPNLRSAGQVGMWAQGPRPVNEELVEVEAGAEGLVKGIEEDTHRQRPEEEGGDRQVPCQAVCVHKEVQRPPAQAKPPEVLPLQHTLSQEQAKTEEKELQDECGDKSPAPTPLLDFVERHDRLSDLQSHNDHGRERHRDDVAVLDWLRARGPPCSCSTACLRGHAATTSHHTLQQGHHQAISDRKHDRRADCQDLPNPIL